MKCSIKGCKKKAMLKYLEDYFCGFRHLNVFVRAKVERLG